MTVRSDRVGEGAGDEPTRVTIRDVARVAGVHISTVSRALDPDKSNLIAEATRQRVIEVSNELGYRPHLIASGLRRGQSRTVGVVVPDLSNPIFAPFARGATHALEVGGFMPLVADTEDDPDRFARILDHLVSRRVEAIIVTAARAGDEACLREMESHGVPMITAVRNVPSSGLPAVIHDDAHGSRLAAQHLLELGHRRFAQVRGPLDVEPFRVRSEAFAAAIPEEFGVRERPPADRPTVEEGRRIASELFSEPGPHPTAVFVQSDIMALGVLGVLRELGYRCPEDVSLVSYNDAAFAPHTDPPLTTLRLGIEEMGRLAGMLALKAIEDPGGELEMQSVAPELIIRGSTAAPPSSAES